MGAGHTHPRARRSWGEPGPGWMSRMVGRVRAVLGVRPAPEHAGMVEIPLALRHGELAESYLAADRGGDHRRAAAAASAAMERAAGAGGWWEADIWGHLALWHFEQAAMTLQAARQARRVGDLRWAAGDPTSARRYYAEAIDEARDIGAEHEQGLAAFGLGRALLDLGEVSEARRLASAALVLLERSGAPAGELEGARLLLGTEIAVGEGGEETE
jgi:tetratricopeptide (TPR) repeat protein